MNLVLLFDEDFASETEVHVSGRRFEHIRSIHRAGIGDTLKVGRLGGKVGRGEITSVTDDYLTMSVKLTDGPPAPLPLTLYLALPRPKFLARILQVATSLGVKRLYVFNSYRVEKIYWSCQQLQPDEVREACLLGLEQARDTILPEIHQRRLFKPFVEDELPRLIRGSSAFVAHPGADSICPHAVEGPISLAIGPEGGFIDYELSKLQEAGFSAVRTYERILKVETAVAAIIGRLV